MEDVNDNGPTFPTSSVRISVAESHPLHAPLYVAHATDPDVVPSHPIRYALGQNSNDLFGIDARSGELYLSRRLDYETQQRHGLLIRALDGGGLSANLSLSVEVQDVNDNPPVFERNEYHVEVPEGAKLDSQVRKIFITRPSRGHLSAGEGRAVGSPFSDMEMFTERRKNRKGGGEVLDLWEDSTLSFPFNSFSNSSSPRRNSIRRNQPPPLLLPFSFLLRLVVDSFFSWTGYYYSRIVTIDNRGKFRISIVSRVGKERLAIGRGGTTRSSSEEAISSRGTSDEHRFLAVVATGERNPRIRGYR